MLQARADIVAEAEEPAAADQAVQVRCGRQRLVVDQGKLGLGVALLDPAGGGGGQGGRLGAQRLELGRWQEVADHHIAVAAEGLAQLRRDHGGQQGAAGGGDPVGAGLAGHVQAQSVEGAAADKTVGAERLGPAEQLERPERGRCDARRLDHA